MRDLRLLVFAVLVDARRVGAFFAAGAAALVDAFLATDLDLLADDERSETVVCSVLADFLLRLRASLLAPSDASSSSSLGVVARFSCV